MHVEMRPLDSVVPYDRNPRLNDDAVGAVARSLSEFGWRQPIVVDGEGVIVVGHTRWKAARSLGWSEAPVHVALDLTPEQARAYRLADNQTATIAEWDMELLPQELRELQAGDFNMEVLGWSPEELDGLLAPPGTGEGLTDPDDTPEPPAAALTRPGDLWVLGEHRLLCGDSTDPAQLARLAGGARADLLVTDPPYGVAYQTKLSREEAVARRRRTDGLEVANDDLGGGGTLELVRGALAAAAPHLRAGAAFYICAPAGSSGEDDMGLVFRSALAGAGLRLRQAIAWVKDAFVMGRQDYHWRHEDILYGWIEGAGHYFVDDRTLDTVWEVPRPKRSAEHPTMKPVELLARAIGNSSRPREVVLDLFGGSGTTLIAAETLGRRALVMELDPRYCDVIARRYEGFTGQRARRYGPDGAELPGLAAAEAEAEAGGGDDGGGGGGDLTTEKTPAERAGVGEG